MSPDLATAARAARDALAQFTAALEAERVETQETEPVPERNRCSCAGCLAPRPAPGAGPDAAGTGDGAGAPAGAALTRERERLRTALAECVTTLEWVASPPCPSGCSREGHAADCRINAALVRAREALR